MTIDILITDIRLPVRISPYEAIESARKIVREKYSIIHSEIYRRSIDARQRHNICFVYSVKITIETKNYENEYPIVHDVKDIVIDEYGRESLSSSPVIVGFGPCGMFCGLVLAEHGYNPIIIERGGSIDERINKVDEFYRTGNLDSETNIQFGAGGAGTFSDGKLTTRINDPKCRYVLNKFSEFGADADILTEAKPHIGTDKLQKIICKINKKILEYGGKIYYNTKMTQIFYNNNTAYKILTNHGEINCGSLIIAAGHSARDIYGLLKNDNYDIINKSFSVGVRIEHLQKDINNYLYGEEADNPLLGAAEYSLSKRVGNEAVYTFCMCPGGEVVAAASETGHLVVNGMSNSKRDGRNSNAALVVSVSPDDPMGFQRRLEHMAYKAGGGDYYAPVQTAGDFINNTGRTDPKRIMPTYMNGKYRVSDLNNLFDKSVSDMLKLGLYEFDKKIKGFAAADSVLTGVESRTSAPYRILRNEDYTSYKYDNVYPCGEGAGYAGGIMSAAIDGINCAIKIMRRYKN